MFPIVSVLFKYQCYYAYSWWLWEETIHKKEVIQILAWSNINFSSPTFQMRYTKLMHFLILLQEARRSLKYLFQAEKNVQLGLH